jgi:hypothetical protein
MWKLRVDLLPLINPPPSSAFAGLYSCASHLGGCLLARAPDLQLDESEVPVRNLLEFFYDWGRLVPLLSRPHPCYMDTMGNHGKQLFFMGHPTQILFADFTKNKILRQIHERSHINWWNRSTVAQYIVA